MLQILRTLTKLRRTKNQEQQQATRTSKAQKQKPTDAAGSAAS
jgi:hypothetical protein